MVQNNMITQGDCIEEMSKMPAESIDLIVTSPPYNMRSKKQERAHRKSRHKMNQYDTCDDNLSNEDYISWQRDCLHSMMRVLKDTGAIYYNHKWRIQNLLLDTRNEIIKGFPLRQIIIWARDGGFNCNNSFFISNYEVIYLIAKRKFKLKREYLGYCDIWHARPDFKNKHPAPFPLEIPLRCIRSSYAKIVLDPFCGSGTTLLAAQMEGRQWIGIDISEKYCWMAVDRVNEKIASDIRVY